MSLLPQFGLGILLASVVLSWPANPTTGRVVVIDNAPGTLNSALRRNASGVLNREPRLCRESRFGKSLYQLKRATIQVGAWMLLFGWKTCFWMDVASELTSHKKSLSHRLHKVPPLASRCCCISSPPYLRHIAWTIFKEDSDFFVSFRAARPF